MIHDLVFLKQKQTIPNKCLKNQNIYDKIKNRGVFNMKQTVKKLALVASVAATLGGGATAVSAAV